MKLNVYYVLDDDTMVTTTLDVAPGASPASAVKSFAATLPESVRKRNTFPTNDGVKTQLGRQALVKKRMRRYNIVTKIRETELALAKIAYCLTDEEQEKFYANHPTDF